MQVPLPRHSANFSGVTLGVYSMLTQTLVPGRRPDVYIPGQTIHAYIVRYWYLVPLIKPPGLPVYSRSSRLFKRRIFQFCRPVLSCWLSYVCFFNDAGYCYRPSSVVGLCVCLLVMFVSRAKTAEPTQTPWVEPRYHVLHWNPTIVLCDINDVTENGIAKYKVNSKQNNVTQILQVSSAYINIKTMVGVNKK